MADRIPLVISDNKLREISASDNLKVSGVVPVTGSTYDLGSSAARFSKLYVDSQGIYTGGLYLKDSNGTLAAFNLDGSAASIAGGVSGLTWTAADNELSAASADGSSTAVVIDDMLDLSITNDIEVGGDIKTGTLYIKDAGSNTIKFTQADGTTDASVSANIIKGTAAGFYVMGSDNTVLIEQSGDAIRLDYNSAVKLGTTTTGVEVIGAITADSATVTNITASNDITAGSLISSDIYNTSGNFDIYSTSGNLSISATGIVDLDGLTGGVKISHETVETLITTATGVDITGTLNVSNNVVISGNLQVDGTQTVANTETFSVDDNMFYLNHAESAGSPTQSVDIGWAGNYNEGGSYAHAGLFRDATDQRFKIFDGYTPEPSGAEINTGDASFALADFQAATFIGALSGNASTATALQTTRAFSLTGDVTASAINFDGTGAVALSTALAANTVSSTELVSASTLLIKNSAGTTVKTIIGAGS